MVTAKNEDALELDAIYLCGGVVQRLRPCLGEPFLEGFCHKARVYNITESIPVYLINDSEVGLTGVAL